MRKNLSQHIKVRYHLFCGVKDNVTQKSIWHMAATCLPDEAMVLLRLTIYRFHSLAYFHFSCFWQNICLIKLNVDISGHYRNCLYSLKTIRTVWKPSGQNCPDKIKTIQTLLYQSRQCWKCPDSVKPVRTVSTLYVQFLNHPDCFKTVWTVLELSGQV